MISVFLCDDETFWLEQLQESILNYKIKSDWEIKIEYQSTSPMELLKYLEDHIPSNGIYFLDIDFKTALNGMQLAEKIRNLDAYASIVFVTTHDEMVMETFRLKLEVLDYIIKDQKPLQAQVHLCLKHIEQKYLKLSSQTPDFITIRVAGSIYTISSSEIVYIESIKNTHKVRIHLHSSIYDFSGSLASLLHKLGNDFFQCHKMYVVNMKHIRKLCSDGHQVILDNKESCACSVREWRRLTEQFQKLYS